MSRSPDQLLIDNTYDNEDSPDVDDVIETPELPLRLIRPGLRRRTGSTALNAVLDNDQGNTHMRDASRMHDASV